MHPKQLQIKDFSYQLPEDRIAHYPLEERDLSKLLIYRHHKITEDTYRHISDYLPENSLLIFNNTRVIHARLFFQNPTGAKIEIFCLEPAEEKVAMAAIMSRTKSVRWKCLVGRASKWKEKTITLQADAFTLTAQILDRDNDAFIIEFSWQPETLTFAEILDVAGMMPIPPYLRRQSEQIDLTRYQTVYAKYEGSVAAPTAGLHFTAATFQKLKEKNILTDEVTLHVGAGTFKPVKSDLMQDHTMHAEVLEVEMKTLKNLLATQKNSIVAVGTTSLRTIESLYWMGVKAMQHPNATLGELEITQWDPYELTALPGKEVALQHLIDWVDKNKLDHLICKTQIIIAPPYQLKVAGALITNFHQPNSTLLLLVAAVTGNNWKPLYDYALQNNFRFLSYGDGSLLFSE